jgi:hypothetical protein
MSETGFAAIAAPMGWTAARRIPICAATPHGRGAQISGVMVWNNLKTASAVSNLFELYRLAALEPPNRIC